MEGKSTFDLFERGQGTITKDELPIVLRCCGYLLSNKEIEDFLQYCSNPEAITFQEVQSLMPYAKKPDANNEKEVLEAFRVFDKNENGMISENDIRVIFTTLGEALTTDEINLLIESSGCKVDDQGRIRYADFVKFFLTK